MSDSPGLDSAIAAYYALGQERARLALEAVLAVEGTGWMLADLEAWLDDAQRREVLMRALRRAEAEPSLLGASSHLLAVGRRGHSDGRDRS